MPCTISIRTMENRNAARLRLLRSVVRIPLNDICKVPSLHLYWLGASGRHIVALRTGGAAPVRMTRCCRPSKAGTSIRVGMVKW